MIEQMTNLQLKFQKELEAFLQEKASTYGRVPFIKGKENDSEEIKHNQEEICLQ